MMSLWQRRETLPWRGSLGGQVDQSQVSTVCGLRTHSQAIQVPSLASGTLPGMLWHPQRLPSDSSIRSQVSQLFRGWGLVANYLSDDIDRQCRSTDRRCALLCSAYENMHRVLMTTGVKAPITCKPAQQV